MDEGDNGPGPEHEKGILENKNTKSQRKKKTKSSGKKSRKKDSSKRSPSPQSNSDTLEHSPGIQEASGSGQRPKKKKSSKRLEKTTKAGKEGKDEEAGIENERRGEEEHSIPRSRSTSRSRFSSLFRRKKKCKSETDLNKHDRDRKEEGEEDEEVGEEEISENPRRQGKRHVSAEDLKRKRGEEEERKRGENLSVSVKPCLKPPSPYHEFPLKTQPRDRLQHMTLNEVAKEQKQKRTGSLPRRRRFFSDDEDDFDSRPVSSSNLADMATHPGDRSPSSYKSDTLPRTRYSSLTAHHSPNHPYAGSPTSSIPSPSSALGSPHFYIETSDTTEPHSSPNSPDGERPVQATDSTNQLQRPPDSAMETSQDSGVVVLGGKNQRRSSRRDSAIRKQEKTSLEKLLELKQSFPHAFTYDDETVKAFQNETKNEDPIVVDEAGQSKQAETVQNDVKSDTETKESSAKDEINSPLESENTKQLSSSLGDCNDQIQEISSALPISSESQSTPESPSIVTSQSSSPVNRQHLNHNTLASLDTNTSSAPSFLIPYMTGGRSTGSSSRVTSMTSSHRSSDQGYVDGDSVPGDEEDDDDNSAFSTPPEDLISDSKNSPLNPEVLHKFLSSVTQNASETNEFFPDLKNDKWDKGHGGDKASLNAITSSSTLDNIPQKGRKASINLKRSKSDVDRRNYKSPRTFSGEFSKREDPDMTGTPVGSIETLSNLSSFSLQLPDYYLHSGLGKGDGDRDSLTSTVTLTHCTEGKALEPQPPIEAEEREEKYDTKSVPVMGTTAQQIYRRNYSPLRARKTFTADTDNLKDIQKKEIPSPSPPDWKPLVPSYLPSHDKRTSPESFQSTLTPKEGFSVPPLHEDIVPQENKDVYRMSPSGVSFNLPGVDSPKISDDVLPPLSHTDKESPLEPKVASPTFFFTGLELHTSSSMPTKVGGLMDCFNDQSLLGQKKEDNKKKNDEKTKKKSTLRRSFKTERELKESSDKKDVEEQPKEIAEPKAVVTENKECQTPPWLLDDLIAPKSPKKPKGILSKKKKRAVESKTMTPLKIPVNKEELQRSSTEVSPPTAEPPKSIEEVFLTPPPFIDNNDTLPIAEKIPVTPESGIASQPTSPTSTKYLPETEEPKAFEAEFHPETSQQSIEEIPEDVPSSSTDQPNLTRTKSKKISLSAIILLKNRIAKYRDRKKSMKETKQPEEEKVEPDLPSDTFMTIENEINLSKLEVSRETDILDAEYFEPEFSLDYSKKQIRFDNMTPVEPVQSEEPLPPLPPAISRRLRQRRKSTMIERRRKCISYCKRFVAFLFSHIGLCSLVVAYTIMGGFIFKALESQAETALKIGIKERRTEILGQIVSMALEMEKNEIGVDNLTTEVNYTLLRWQKDIHHATKDQGWDGTEMMGNEGEWTFASSLLYAITVTTTIGFGHVAPKTPEGRLVTIGYAVVGIPLTLLCLTNIGDVMATGFRLLYGKVCCGICCTMFKPKRRRIPPDLEKGLGRTMVTTEKEESDKPKEVIHVPTSLCLLLIASYIFAGAMLFSMWENWDLLTGSYFCFITLSTIGFGDIVPGMETNAWSGEEKLVLCALYLVMGLSLIAMCFNLVQEDVKTKCRWLGEKLGIVDKPETPI